MIRIHRRPLTRIWLTVLSILIVGGWPGLTLATGDTDIYKVTSKQNCYVLMDNSGSMAYGVYAQNIDYGDLYDYLISLYDGGDNNPYDSSCYIFDYTGNDFYGDHYESNKIYLWLAPIGVTVSRVNGSTISFTGDAGNSSLTVSPGDIVDTHTLIDPSTGKLIGDGQGSQRVTTDANGNILLDGSTLPVDRNTQLHKMVTLYDGSQVDNGFDGLLDAPGFYYSGYYSDNGSTSSMQAATTTPSNSHIYLFVTGNWLNMHQVYNLYYAHNSNNMPSGAQKYDQACFYEPYTITNANWPTMDEAVQYPDGGIYSNNLSESTTQKTIVDPGATQIQIHFSAFDVQGDGNSSVNNPYKSSNFTHDWVALYDANGNLVAKYDNDNNPVTNGGWSPVIDGDTVKITLYSDSDTGNGGSGYTGYKIDESRFTSGGSYVMQSRMDVAKDAMDYVLDAFYGKINWGYATFHYTSQGSGDGASLQVALNATTTDDANSTAMKNHVDATEPEYGTPLGEALQDIFYKGYYTSNTSLANLSCRKNYVIVVTDGYPSDDNDWSRISGGPTFSDFDKDGFTEDPSQYTTPPPDYLDDVGHWMYTHSWKDSNMSLITDPASSYDNVITQYISFGMNNALLKDAAGDSGGVYMAAYNKAQLVAAFYSLALQITEAISFTSPVVSVDSANKIENGDDVYLGLFLPQDNTSWVGNLRKFKLGDGSTDRPDTNMLYDYANVPAIDGNGNFKDNTTPFWGAAANSSQTGITSGMEVRKDGVGEVMTKAVQAYFQAGTYWDRPIYTCTDSLQLEPMTSVTASQLGVSDELTRDKILNYVYGYTYDANSTSTSTPYPPVAARDWALGSIVHSRPAVIDYYSTSGSSTLEDRYIAVGANDGMLHVFNDADGTEIFSFVPPDLLTKLSQVAQQPFVPMVDGSITIYKKNGNPKYLIFGERRGGGAYWCIDISDPNPQNWTVAWKYTNSEMVQSWSKAIVSSIPVGVDSAGQRTFQDVLIFTGGYDPLEDDFPEPFDDTDNTGTVFMANGNVDTQKWGSSDDLNNNGQYDLYNPGIDTHGRGVYVVDIDDPSKKVYATGSNDSIQLLPFSATYGTSNATTGVAQTLTSFKYCFPASPAVVSGSYSYIDTSEASPVEQLKSNVLKCFYAIDIYANLYRINYNFDVTQDPNTSDYSLSSAGWQVTEIFSGNPGSTSTSGQFGQGVDTSDQGRKAFYPPAVSWGGSCSYFDASNYTFPNVTFSGLNDIATLYFGTGDRAHPTYTMIKNRFYAVYDDSSITAVETNPTTNAQTPITVSTVPYTENNLVNLTCNELDSGTTVNSGPSIATIETELTDDATYNNGGSLALENGTHEDDAKGWYIVLADQQDPTYCSSCSYATADTSDHQGEKVLGAPELYDEVIYFTSYAPSISDPCNPQGNGFLYALSYCDATAVGHPLRSEPVIRIPGIPPGPAIIIPPGAPIETTMMGSKIINQNVKTANPGLQLYYWRDSNSQN